MTDAAATTPSEAPPPQLPLFYKRVVGVNPTTHGSLRLDRGVSYAFSAEAQSVPLGLGEFDAAAQHFPIVFTTGPNPMPVVLLGLRQGHNLFVQPDGTWRPNTYVPAYIRAFPFIFVEDPTAKTTYVGMEPDAACLRQNVGLNLFEDGKPSATLNEAIGFCSSYRDNLTAAGVLAKALDDAGLLAEEEANINFTAGGNTRIRGFKLLSPDRLDKVSDETFLEWRHKGWLGPIFAHFHSAGRWAKLIEFGAPELSKAA